MKLTRLPDSYFLATDFVIHEAESAKKERESVSLNGLMMDMAAVTEWKLLRRKSGESSSKIDHQSFLEYLQQRISELILDKDAVSWTRQQSPRDLPTENFQKIVARSADRSPYLEGVNLHQWTMCINRGGYFKKRFDEYSAKRKSSEIPKNEHSQPDAKGKKFFEELDLWKFAVSVYLPWFNERGYEYLTLIDGTQVFSLNDVMDYYDIPKEIGRKSGPRIHSGTSPESKELFKKFAEHGFVTRSQIMTPVLEEIERHASAKIGILLLGNTGSGKTTLATIIHSLSKRPGKFIRVNCSNLPDHLLESELFGHKKGAFTGASEDKTGAFQEADRGTIFLDEIGDMSRIMQAKLRIAVEEKKIKPIGYNEERDVDVRIICATNVDLEKAIAKGEFLEDLYDRVAIEVIRVPPLLERRKDIPALACFFFEKKCREEEVKFDFRPSELGFQSIQPSDVGGNVRKLESLIHRMVVWMKHHPHPGNRAVKQFLSGNREYPTGMIDVPFSVSQKELDLIRTHIKYDFRWAPTAKRLYDSKEKRFILKKKILSLYLKLGRRFDFKEARIAEFLVSEAVIEQNHVPALVMKILEYFKEILAEYPGDKKNRLYYKRDVPVIEQLIEHRTDLI